MVQNLHDVQNLQIHEYKYEFNALGFTAVALLSHTSEMGKKMLLLLLLILRVPIVVL